MALYFVEKDIVTMKTDAIVNAANEGLWRGGGVCGAIFLAAGADELQEECQKKAPCPTGKAVITSGYRLPARFIVHAVGPRWSGGAQGERALLAGAYESALKLAQEHGCKSIAFPLISAGIYGYPKAEALTVAVEAIRHFLNDHEMDVYLTFFGRPPVKIPEELAKKVEECSEEWETLRYRHFLKEKKAYTNEIVSAIQIREDGICEAPHMPMLQSSAPRKLEDLLDRMEESFSEMLLRLIDEKGYTDVEVYKRANLDRKLFSKIRSNRDYIPKKPTIFALAVGMRLSEDETIDLLGQAGYAFSGSRKMDVIVQYYISKKEYNIDLINETLLYYEQPILGSSDK
ncbi:MAG: macro domain-containing protein [Lachnospiraceae bacterium]|nr:macro domain-containing protein [Lachnospiraceae bacterium]